MTTTSHPTRAALFDLDGVVLDTESQYTRIWQRIGLTYRPDVEHLEQKIKGMTLASIFDAYFAGRELQAEITRRLDEAEACMTYGYVAGLPDFVADLHRHGIRTAIVTSSNNAKMANVYAALPEFRAMFDAIITADRISRSKPDPECYLLAAAELGALPRHSCVFEDSFHGLEAGRRAAMHVVGLATTNPRRAIAPLADLVIDDFEGFGADRLPW